MRDTEQSALLLDFYDWLDLYDETAAERLERVDRYLASRHPQREPCTHAENVTCSNCEERWASLIKPQWSTAPGSPETPAMTTIESPDGLDIPCCVHGRAGGHLCPHCPRGAPRYTEEDARADGIASGLPEWPGGGK